MHHCIDIFHNHSNLLNIFPNKLLTDLNYSKLYQIQLKLIQNLSNMTNEVRKRRRSGEIGCDERRSRARRMLDPMLVIPNELHELIFQHLSGNDVLNASEVSRLWNQETLDSKACGKTFKININDIFKLPEIDELRLLKNSLRKYKHIHIRWDYLGSDGSKCWDLLKAHSQDIETLSIVNLMLVYYSNATLELPKLTKLTIAHHTDWLNNPTYFLLKANNNLTCLTLDADFDMRFCDFFEQNQTLKELQLSGNLIHSLLLMNSLNDVKFKLRKFKISRSIINFMYNNFDTFLKSQAESLEEIEVYGVATRVFNLLFNDFKLIRDLNVRRVFNFYYINVNPNETIRTFSSDLPLEGLAPIIIAASNLEVLTVHILKVEMMEFVARNARSLRKLYYKGKIGAIFSCYNNLKASTIDLNRNIEISEVS